MPIFHQHSLIQLLQRLLPTRVRVVIFLIAVGVCFGLFSVAYLALSQFGPYLATSNQLGEDRGPVRGGKMTADLFDHLLNQKILIFDEDQYQFNLTIDCLAWRFGLKGEGSSKPSNETGATNTLKRDQVVARFCNTDLGHSINEEINAWNSSLAVVAVRDNRSIGQPCKDGTPVTMFIPNGCYGNHWTAGRTTENAATLGNRDEESRPESDRAIAPQQVPIPQTRPHHPPGQPAVANSAPDKTQSETIKANDKPAPARFAAVASFGSPSPEVYGFLARNPIPGFGDWRQFTGLGGGNQLVEVTTMVAPLQNRAGSRKIYVDAVGEVTGAWAQHTNSQRPRPANSNDTHCERFRRAKNCEVRIFQRNPDAPTPRAHRIEFQMPANWSGQLRLLVKPKKAVHARVRALVAPESSRPKARFSPPSAADGVISDQGPVVRFTTHIVARCRDLSPDDVIVPSADGGDEYEGQPDQETTGGDQSANNKATKPRCSFAWLPSSVTKTGAQVAQAGSVIITTSGDEPVALSEARPVLPPEVGDVRPSRSVATLDAVAMGLLPIVGADDTDPRGLLGQLRDKALPNSSYSVDLSIDARVQRTVFGGLSRLMNGVGFLDIQPKLLPGREDYRHGNIVLLDAGAISENGAGPGAQTGRILAAASWPQLHGVSSKSEASSAGAGIGLAEWDLQATETFDPTESRLAARVWSQNNRLYAPGSSFKIFVALSAIDAVTSGTHPNLIDIARYMGFRQDIPYPPDGGMGPAEFNREIGPAYGFSFRSKNIHVPNFGVTPPKPMMIGKSGVPVCQHIIPPDCQNGRINLVDMLAKSDNLYFARLALLLDDEAIVTKGSDGTTFRDWILRPNDEGTRGLTLVAMANRLWPSRDVNLLPQENLDRYSRLEVSPLVLDSVFLSTARLHRLALNGIGQALQATPLTMASIAGSIASERVILPRIAGAPVSSTLTPVFDSPEKARGAYLMMEELRKGMKAVVTVGTGANAFARNPWLRDRVWGKTGTAETGFTEADGNTAWFVGWINGLPGYEGRRIAFACMISHITVDNAGGGSVCAPLMRAVFEALEPPPQEAAPGQGETRASP